VRGTLNRPDVQVLRLQRKIEVLESLVDLASREHAWKAEFVEALTPYQFSEVPLERIGSIHDGGYILPFGVETSVRGVVSVGVGSNVDADVVLAERGLRVHAWDHTVPGLPKNHANITFHEIGLGEDAPSLLPLEALTAGSFGSDAEHLVLMLDAEGAEWKALAQATDETLQRFGVVAVELHDMGNLILDPGLQISVLQRLYSLFVPVAVHINNHAAQWVLPGLVLPDALEVTYVNRRRLQSKGLAGNAPSELFSPCCPDLDEAFPSWI